MRHFSQKVSCIICFLSEAIYIMRERTRADFAKAVEFGDVFNANNGVGHRAEEVAWASGGLLQRETFLFNPKTLSPIQPCLCQAMVL